jgi:urease accessory protein
MNNRLSAALLTMLMTTVSESVWAHTEAGQASGLIAGLLHPVSGLDHVIAMVAVGLWGAQLGRPAVWVLPVAFPMVMAVGGFLGLVGVHLPGIELGIALSGVILGLAVMKVWRPPLTVALALVAGFAIFHGHAHGVELPAGANGLTYSFGFVIATGLLHGVGIALGLIQLLPRGDLALRGMGAAVSLGGVYFLHGALV